MDFIPIPRSLRPAMQKLKTAELGRLFEAVLRYTDTGEQYELLGKEIFAFEVLKAEVDAIRENPDHSTLPTEGMNIRPAYFPYPSCETQPVSPESPPLSIYNISSSNSISSEKKEDKQEKEDEKRDKGVQGGKRKPPFVPPTLEEIQAYVAERKSPVNPEAFYNFYQAKGWMIGKNKMQNWHAAISTWERREKESAGSLRSGASYPTDGKNVPYTPLPGETFL